MLTLDHFMCIDYLAQGSHCDNGVVDDSGAVSFSTDHPGGDSVSLQTAFDATTSRFRTYKGWADSSGSIFWPKIASMRYQDWCGGNCYERGRRASGYELLAHAGLALAYGADALTFWHWGWDYCYVDGIYPGSPGYSDVRDLVSPFVVALGDLFYDLRWINAGKSETVGSMTGSFSTSVQSANFGANPFVEVAFFKDTVTNDDYFMVVNRRCLASEAQNLTVALNRPPGMYYIVDQYSRDTTIIGSLSAGGFAYRTSLSPGQGKLFKVVPLQSASLGSNQLRAWLSGLDSGMYRVKEILSNGSLGDSTLTGSLPDGRVPFTGTFAPNQSKSFKILPGPALVSGSSFPATWQGGIWVGGNVTMAAGRTWNILPPARVRVDAGASYWIDVYGNMVAEGTVTDAITFLSAAASPAANDWYGIRARGTGNVTMKFVEVHHAYKGLWLWNTAATITATIEHCLFRRHYLSGISIDASPASSIAVRNSEFRDWGYYGVQIHFGKVDVDDNRFDLGGLNGIRVEGNYRDTVTGGHIRGNTFTTLSQSSATGIYIYGVRNDGLNWTMENLLEDNRFWGGSWSSPNQVAIQVLNCMDTLSFFRNAVWGVSGKPGFGLLINSTQVRMFGDLTRAERESAIDSVRYGLYCFNGLVNDPDYAIVRACSFRAFAGSDTAYDVWISPLGKADLGHSGDLGNNVFRGQCNTPPPAYTVYNTNLAYMLPARGNYWSAPGPLPLDEETIPPPTPCYYSSNNVDFTGYLASNPFAGGSPKLAVAEQTPIDPAKSEFGHLASYPNPFNSSTVLKFSLAHPGRVEVAVFNILGQRVKTVCKDDRAAGEHQVIWDGQDEQSKPVASGVYFYTVTSGGRRLSKSIVLLK